MSRARPTGYDMIMWLRDYYDIPQEHRSGPGWRDVKLVVLALLTRRNIETGECYPSIERCCEDWNPTKARFIKGIQLAERWGLLRVIRRKGKANRYSFPLIEAGARCLCAADRGGSAGGEPSTSAEIANTSAEIETGVVLESVHEQRKDMENLKAKEQQTSPA